MKKYIKIFALILTALFVMGVSVYSNSSSFINNDIYSNVVVQSRTPCYDHSYYVIRHNYIVGYVQYNDSLHITIINTHVKCSVCGHEDDINIDYYGAHSFDGSHHCRNCGYIGTVIVSNEEPI